MYRITRCFFISIFMIIFSVNSENLPGTLSQENFIYQASVQNSLNKHFCNGVILDQRWILTLGQCVLNRSANEFRIFYGSNHLNSNGSYTSVKQIFLNPAFNLSIIKNDIALLLTSENITFIANVSGSIDLPTHDISSNQRLVASWCEVNVSKYGLSTMKCISK